MKPTSPSTESVFDDVSQNDDSSSGRSRASTGDMSCDSLEGGEKVADKNCALLLCTALENVQIKTNDVTENNEISPEKRKTVRRSMRKTPSKYKTPLKDIENVWVNREEVSHCYFDVTFDLLPLITTQLPLTQLPLITAQRSLTITIL